jgi:hypothetical protein
VQRIHGALVARREPKSHASDEDVKEYLLRCPKEVIFDLAQILGDPLGFNGMKSRVPSVAAVPMSKAERQALVADIVKEIGYFGSNNFAYVGRWMLRRNRAVGYHQVVFDVVKALNRQLKRKLDVPRVASVSERERMVCDQLLGIAFQGKSEEEIARMLKEAGLQHDAIKAAAIKAAVQGGAGGLIVALVKLLGKKTVTNLLSAMVIKLVAAKIGKVAAEKLALAVLKQVPQKTVAAFMTFVGTALIAKDVVDLAAPGTRVTIPAVALVAGARMAEELSS